ncbi:MAG: peptidylprolyl isomerase [Verrucomicrobiota bacterium]
MIRTTLILLTIAGLISCSPKDPSDPKFIVAKVDGTKILRAELDESIDLFLKSQRRTRDQIPEEMLPHLEYRMINQIVDGTLVINALEDEDSAKLGEEVEKEFAAFKERFDDDTKYQETLDNLELSEELLQKQIRESVAQRIMIDQAQAKAKPVSDEDAKAFYDQNPQYWEQPETVNARHILIRADKSSPAADQAAAKKKAEAARKRVTGGEDFATVAAEVSDDPGSKARGGMLPPFQQGQMVPEFEKVAFTSKAGTVSPVFQSDFGYHFMEVISKQEAGTIAYEEVADRIKENLQGTDIRKELEFALDSLRDQADIEIMIPEPDTTIGGPGAPAGLSPKGGPPQQ